MGLFAKTSGQGWSFDKKSGRLTISGDMGDASDFLDPFDNIRKKVRSIVSLKGASVNNGYNLFSNMENLVTADLSELDVSQCESMHEMFNCCKSLTSLDLSTWNTSNVKSMSWMFQYCNNLESVRTGSKWSPLRVTDTFGMFAGCSKLRELDICVWPSSFLDNCAHMFIGCTALEELNLSSMDVSNVKEFHSMFSHCRSLRSLDLSGWDTSAATNMETMFSDCPKLETLDLTDWCIGEDTNTDSMFEGIPRSVRVIANSETVERLLPKGISAEPPTPQLTIAVLGHIGHGKSTLTAAIREILSQRFGFVSSEDVYTVNELSIYRIKMASSAFFCETPKRLYTVVDCPGHSDWVKNLIANPKTFDGAILVVDVMDGPMSQTREQLLLAREMGISSIVVFLNNRDNAIDEEICDLVEMETRELLDEYGFRADYIPIVAGSALEALMNPEGSDGDAVLDLLNAMDNTIPERNSSQPSLMKVNEAVPISENCVSMIGCTTRGTIRTGDVLELIGFGDEVKKVSVTQIHNFRRPIETAKARCALRFELTGLSCEDFQEGKMLAQPGSISAHFKFIARVYYMDEDEGAINPFYSGTLQQFCFNRVDVNGHIVLPDWCEVCLPGFNLRIAVELDYPVAMELGSSFVIHVDEHYAGIGTVIGLID